MALLQAGIGFANQSTAVVTMKSRQVNGLPVKSGGLVQSSLKRVGVSVWKDEGRQSASCLRWANGGGFGVATNGVFLTTSTVNPRCNCGSASTQRGTLQVSAAFTPEQSKMVKDSWKLLQKNNPGEHALKFFLKVFEIAPTVKKMFSFLRESDVPLEKNPHLKAHALTVLSMTGQAAAQLGEKGALDSLMPKLMELGHSHVAYGVVDEHFDVVKFALLMTLAEALPEKWSPAMKEAWSVAYDEIVKEIKGKMHAERATTIRQLATV